MSSIPNENFPPRLAAAPETLAVPVGPQMGFTYQAQDDAGRRVTGTIDAADAGTAVMRLTAMRLRVTDIAPLEPATDSVKRGRPIRGDDFLAFNQQLAHLAAAGLPVETGLRLIARDLRRGRLAQTVQSVAEELDKGTPLPQAFARHGARFPSLYGRLLDAGVRSGNLGGVLLSFGKHLEMVQRLRSILWRTVSYPLMVFVVLLLILTFMGMYILPQMREIYENMLASGHVSRVFSFGSPNPMPSMPIATVVLFNLAEIAPYFGVMLIVLAVAGPVFWGALRLRGWDRNIVDTIVLRIPLVGRALKMNLIARWCDALRIGVASGMPLPAAIGLAGDSVRSPRLRRDGQVLIDRLEAGRPLDDGTSTGFSLLPATIPAAIQLSSGHQDLPATLATLAELYERQAELRVNRIPAILTPGLVAVIAVTIGYVMVALLLPLVQLIEAITS